MDELEFLRTERMLSNLPTLLESLTYTFPHGQEHVHEGIGPYQIATASSPITMAFSSSTQPSPTPETPLQITDSRGMHLVSVLVHSYDEGIAFFVQKLGFILVEDSPSFTNAGLRKRWVVVRPPTKAGTDPGFGIVLARADGPEQEAMIGKQFAGRVGLFWAVDDFDIYYARLLAAGVQFLTKPKDEEFGRYAVFTDLSGNKWDLLGPVPPSAGQA